MFDKWTPEQLDSMLPKLKAVAKEELQQITDECPGTIKPIPALTKTEAYDYLTRLISLAGQRKLEIDEQIVFEQFLEQYTQSVIAETLGKKGRFYVITDDTLNPIIDKIEKKNE